MEGLRQRPMTTTMADASIQPPSPLFPFDASSVKVSEPTSDSTFVNAVRQGEEEKPSKWKVWILASRPHTLTASIAPILVGSALVKDDSVWPLAATCAAFSCLIQLGTNLHNDYADFVKGADTDKRVGHARATQRGWLTPTETASASTLCLLLASLVGVTLTYLAATDPTMAFATLSSVFNAVAYTGGHYPLGYIGLGNLSIGYSGWGDLFVFLYFGLVATMAVPYLYIRIHQRSTLPLFHLLISNKLLQASFLVAIPVGFLATAIIVVNNLRDRHTDLTAGKRTLAVRWGERFARWEYASLIIGSYVALVPITMCFGIGGSLPLLSTILILKPIRAVAMGQKDGMDLNEFVGGTARIQLFYCILLMIGLRFL